jgi:hypothetical protein
MVSDWGDILKVPAVSHEELGCGENAHARRVKRSSSARIANRPSERNAGLPVKTLRVQ